MRSASRRGWRWRGLGIKLFVSYLAVVVVGLLTIWVATGLAAPPFFAGHMRQMRAAGNMEHGLGPGAVMGPMARPEQLDRALEGSFRMALIQALLVATTAASLTALGASLLVTRRILGPIRRLLVASQRVAAGHYAERVPTGTDDELGDLADSFNEMAGALEATERRRLELIGDVSHEMRTPVATLEGYLEGLLDGVVEPSARTWAKLHDEAGRLRRLIDDLQELSRAEAHQIPLRLQVADPGEIARAAVERLAVQFTEKGLALVVDLPPGLPPVSADQDRAVQVLTNLLTNALRYTPAPGTVQVSASPQSGVVRFTVADTGVGIAAEHLPHLFERFYRVDKSRSRALGGSGIGLTVARALVEAMGGHIWAESPGSGSGATFSFTLPVDQDGASDVTQSRRRPANDEDRGGHDSAGQQTMDGPEKPPHPRPGPSQRESRKSYP